MITLLLVVLVVPVVVAEVVNLSCWWWLFGRTGLAPWNWRVLGGPKPYTSWVIGELIEQEIRDATEGV